MIGFYTLVFGLWIWALMDISKSRFKTPGMKIIWFLIVFVFSVLGSIIYFQRKRKLVIRKPRKFQPKFKKLKTI